MTVVTFQQGAFSGFADYFFPPASVKTDD